MSERFSQMRDNVKQLADFDEEAHESEAELMKMLFEDSDDELAEQEREPILNRIPNKNRNAMAGHEQLMRDYLNEDLTYTEKDSEHRFRVTKGVFIQLCNDLQCKIMSPYFIQQVVCRLPSILRIFKN